MRDMPSLTDENLAAMAAEHQKTDLERGRDKVFNLEAQLVSARARPVAGAAMDSKQMDNLRAIDRLRDELDWAKKSLAMIEDAARSRELQQAKDAAPGESFYFEIETPDRRKIRQEAKDAATLQKTLGIGYTVTGRVFPCYVAPVDPAAGNLLSSLLKAHGDELAAWLEDRGVILGVPNPRN
jgi:hypothetical protein